MKKKERRCFFFLFLSWSWRKKERGEEKEHFFFERQSVGFFFFAIFFFHTLKHFSLLFRSSSRSPFPTPPPRSRKVSFLPICKPARHSKRLLFSPKSGPWATRGGTGSGFKPLIERKSDARKKRNSRNRPFAAAVALLVSILFCPLARALFRRRTCLCRLSL